MGEGTELVEGTDRNANPFDALASACLQCGLVERSGDCSGCDTSAMDVQCAPALLGARLRARSGYPAGMVVAVDEGVAALVHDDGSERSVAEGTLDPGQVLVMAAAPPAEQLFNAVFRWQVPEPARDRILRIAVDATQRAPRPMQLRVAEIAYAMGRDDWAEPLNLAPMTAMWLQAGSLARAGELEAASRLLTELPAGVFPARLGIWAQAVPTLSAVVSSQVQATLGGFEGLSETHDAAVEVVRVALADAEADACGQASTVRQRLAVSMPQLCPRYRTRVEHASENPHGRLLRLVEESPAELAQHPGLLAHASEAVLDELIETNVITVGWLELELPEPVFTYVAARLDPTRLDDAAVKRLGLGEEQARRAVLRGQSVPSELSQEVTRRYQALGGLLAGDAVPASAMALASDETPFAEDLQQALDHPGRVPDEDLLWSPVARQALARQALSGLKLGEVDAGDLSTDQARFVGTVALEQSRHALYRWSWQDAIAHAKQCLRLCDDEPIRDEALNLIAAASWQLGNDDAAIGALQTALDGEYTLALQANIGLVAQQLAPDLAGQHLARLITDAPDLGLRVEAAKRTLAIWQAKELPGDEGNDLPTDIAHALRTLMNQPIDADDFRLLAVLLADHDADWMATFDTQTSSPHAGSAAARLYAARARGIDEFVATLAELLQAGNAPEWVARERDQLVDAVIDALVAEEPMVGAVSVAELMLQHRLPMDQPQPIVVRALTARMVAVVVIGDQEGEPALRFLDALEHDAAQLDTLEPEDRDWAQTAVQLGFDAVARAYLSYRWERLRNAAASHDDLAATIASIPRSRRNRGAIQQAATELEQATRDSRQLFTRLRRNVTDELAEAIDGAIGACDQLIQAAQTLPRT